MKRLGVLLVAAVFLLVACGSDNRSTSTYWAYERPNEECQESRAELGFELFCAEGQITVELVALPAGETMQSVLSEQVESLPDPADYTIIEIESDTEPTHMLVLAELSGFTIAKEGDRPTYLAVVPFGEGHVAIGRGYVNEQDFEEEFRPIFRSVVRTLETTGQFPSSQ